MTLCLQTISINVHFYYKRWCVHGIVSLINGDHFFLFQNPIFRLNSRVLCECLVIKDLQKRRISFDSHKYAPPFFGSDAVWTHQTAFLLPVYPKKTNDLWKTENSPVFCFSDMIIYLPDLSL